MKSSSFHARSPEAYEAFMGRWSRRLCKPYVDFIGMRTGARIIDVGCGTGSLTFVLAETAPISEVVGVDLSDAYLQNAKSKNREPRVAFQKSDATRLDFPDGAFDQAVSMLVLQFVPDPDRAVAEMKRVTRRGGLVSAAVWDSFGGVPAHRIFWDAAAHLAIAADKDLSGFFFRPMTRPDELAAAWSRHGLTNVEQSSLTIRMDYQCFDDYWAPIAAGEATLGKFASELSPEKRASLEAMVRLSYLGGQPDGPRSFAATAWVCKGTVG